MATTKEKGLYVLIALAFIIGVAVVYYVFFRDECDPDKIGYTKKGKISEKCVGKVQDPKTDNTPKPVGCSQWLPDNTFPLKKCQSGTKIKALQIALGFTGTSADGRFGVNTESAVYNKFKKNEVTEAEYNALINPPTPPTPPATGGGSNYADLKKTLGVAGKNISGGVSILQQGQNKNYAFDFYTNGRFFFREVNKSASDALYKGTYSGGGKKMVIDGGNAYESSLSSNAVFSNMSKIVSELGS